jgi:hypothetical protein
MEGSCHGKICDTVLAFAVGTDPSDKEPQSL